MDGRWWGDGGEMEGRWWGDGGEMEGRWWGYDGARLAAHPLQSTLHERTRRLLHLVRV